MALKLTAMDLAPPAPPPPRVGMSTRESQRRVRDLVSKSRLPSRQQLQQHRRELEETARRESLRLQAAQHYQGGSDAGGGDDGPWDATTSELRNQQFDLVDAFVENPTKVFTTAEMACMPWWLRIIHDPEFKKAVTTSITAEIRHFEEHDAQRNPQILVTTPGAWNPKSSLNRVPGDGLTYRWLVSFPVTGFVHLPFITSRALEQPGCAGVHVFAAADAKNYAAKKDALPFAAYPMPGNSASEKPRGIAAVVHSAVAPPQQKGANGDGAASPDGVSPASPTPPNTFPPDQQQQQGTVLTAATTAQLSARKAAAEAKALRKKKRLARRREADAAAQLSEVYQAKPGTTFPPRLWNFKTTDQERAEKLKAKNQRRGSRTLGQYRDGASTSDTNSDDDGAAATTTTAAGNTNRNHSGAINLFRNVHDDIDKDRVPPIEYVGTLRASHRLLRFRFLSRALYNVCKGTPRAPYGRYLTAGIPNVTDVLEFKSYDRSDLTDSRIEFLFSSDSCRAAMKTIFSELPKDINGRATKPGMVQLVLDLVGLFMPSFYTQSNIELAEDEWVCRGTCERPDFYQFCWFFFDFPMIVMRSEFLSEDLYAAFWKMVHHQIFVLRRNNSDGYDDHILRQQMLLSAEVQQLSPSRRAHHVQRRLDLMHAAKRREEHRRQLEEQYEAAMTDPSAISPRRNINASFGGTGGSALLEMVASPPHEAASPSDSAGGGSGPNEYLDRRRAGLDVLSEWRKHRVGQQQQPRHDRCGDSEGGPEHHHGTSQRTERQHDEDGPQEFHNSTIADVDAEIDEVRAALDAHDAENADLGNDRDDVDSLLSYCSDVSEREFESDNFRVRDKYQRRKAQERDADRVTIRRRLKILTVAKKRMQDEEQERIERRAEEARRQEEAQLASFIDVAAISGTVTADPSGASIARNRQLFASIRAAIHTASLSSDKKHMSGTAHPHSGEEDEDDEEEVVRHLHHHRHHREKQPVPPAIAARAREERRRRIARLDSRGGPRKQYSMFCAPNQHIPAPPPAPPATTAELAAQVDGMSPWAAKIITNPGAATQAKKQTSGEPPKPKRIESQPSKPKAPEEAHEQQQQQFRVSLNDLASPTFAPSEAQPVPTSARRQSAPKISRLSELNGCASTASKTARPSVHRRRASPPSPTATGGSSNSKRAPRRPTAAFGTAPRGNAAGLDPGTAPVKEQKMSRSMLTPSRALQALFPLHPRTVLVGQPAGELRPDTR